MRSKRGRPCASVKNGGQLMAGADPSGNGGALAGFADQRNIELLVEAGFTPAEAIRIYTLNAAQYSASHRVKFNMPDLATL